MLTILQAAMLEEGKVHKQTVVRTFSETNPILERLPFVDIDGAAYEWTKEAELPDVGFRAVNGSFSESTGALKPELEQLTIMGGDVFVDRVLVRRHGAAIRAKHEEMKVIAMAHKFGHNFFKGDQRADAAGFEGLQRRCVGDRIIVNGGAGNTTGLALSLAYLDAAISNTANPTGLAMSRKLKLRMSAAMRDQALAGNLSETRDSFGRPIMAYGGLPIMEFDQINDPYETLGFTELSPNGLASDNTSIYVVSLGNNGIVGIQNPGGIDVRDLGETKETGKSGYITRVDWECSFAPESDYCVTRLMGITDAPIAA